MDVIVERPAALDVHNATVMACVRVPGERRRCAEQVAEFQTTVQGLLALRDWLEAHEVDQVAMEATGAYWRPVWAVLAATGSGASWSGASELISSAT